MAQDSLEMIESMIRAKIQDALTKCYPELAAVDFTCTHPEDLTHGDFACNVAMVLARQVGDSPLNIAQKLAEALEPDETIASVEAVAPGFLNLFLTRTFLWHEVHKALKVDYGRVTGGGQKIVFEFGQPNSHKLPHVGHLFSYIYGESCSRLLEAAGNQVIRVNYQGDIGPHVAKCLWAYIKHNQIDPDTLDQKVAYLQLCYQEGSGVYDDDPEAKSEIDALNTRLYQNDPELMPIWHKTRQWCVDSYDAFEKRLGINYQHHYWESQIYAPGIDLVRAKLGSIFAQDEGTIIFRGEPYGLHTRVFINRHGNPTYEAKDLGLVQQKWQDYQFDRAIVEVGNDQKEYWQVEKQVINLLFPELTGKVSTHHHGMINLSTGKMSSRTGEIVTAFSLVAQIRDMIASAMAASTKKSDFTDAEHEQVIETLAIGAIKYSFLKSAAEKNITFDLATSVSNEGNSGPYLQYTYARCQSILSGLGAVDYFEVDSKEVLNADLNDEELVVIRLIYRFPLVVAGSAERLAPHSLCTYLYELAQAFSYFYNQHRILGVETATQKVRTLITASTASILKNGLDLLGIEVTDRV